MPFFATHLDAFFQHRSDENHTPDLITTYPGHEGGYHDGLVALAREVVSEREVQYQPVLSRGDTRPSQRSLDGHERWENQLWSLRVNKDVEGKTIFLLDDVCTTGASLTTGTNNLLNAGAERVICICLGLATGQWGEYVKQLRDEHHTIMNTIDDDE